MEPRPISTPCIKSLRRQRSDCGRTLAEIAGWAAMDVEKRREIMAELAGRLAERQSR